MNYETKSKIQAALSPYNKRKQTITVVINDKLHFVTGFYFSVGDGQKMQLHVKECGPFETGNFVISEDSSGLGPIIFHN